MTEDLEGFFSGLPDDLVRIPEADLGPGAEFVVFQLIGSDAAGKAKSPALSVLSGFEVTFGVRYERFLPDRKSVV